MSGSGTGTPTVANGVIYVSVASSVHVVALRADDGEQLWIGRAGTSFTTGWPSVGYGKVFIGDSSGEGVVGFDENTVDGCHDESGTWTCAPIWAARGFTSQVFWTSAVANGSVFYPNGQTVDANGVKNCSGQAPVTCTPLMVDGHTGGRVDEHGDREWHAVRDAADICRPACIRL